jgi:hypothetical protein
MTTNRKISLKKNKYKDCPNLLCTLRIGTAEANSTKGVILLSLSKIEARQVVRLLTKELGGKK